MTERWRDWAPVPLRLVFGIGFVIHGFPKLFGGHEGFAGMLQDLGVPAPDLMAWIVGIVEFFGGILLILGAFVTIVSVLGIIEMLVAKFLVHLPGGFLYTNEPPGIEVPFLYLGAFLALILSGAGPLSVDRMRRKRQPGAPERRPAEAEERRTPETEV